MEQQINPKFQLVEKSNIHYQIERKLKKIDFAYCVVSVKSKNLMKIFVPESMENFIFNAKSVKTIYSEVAMYLIDHYKTITSPVFCSQTKKQKILLLR